MTFPLAKKDSSPLVTIGIPTANRGESFLTHALESALAQTHIRIEAIVSDNCSEDNTEKIVRCYKDRRVVYHRQRALLTPHKNADFCLQQAKGEYFLLLHDDDLIDPDFIEACLAVLMKEPGIAFVSTGARTIDCEGNVSAIRPNSLIRSTDFEYFDAILRGSAVTYFCNTLYRTECLRSVGGFQSRAYVYQDVITNLKLARIYGRASIRGPKASYRVHHSKLGSTSDIRKWCDDSLNLLEVMCDLMPEKAAYFRKEGMRILCRKSCSKRARPIRLPMRIIAYFIVFGKFRHIPVFYFLIRLKERFVIQFRSHRHRSSTPRSF